MERSPKIPRIVQSTVSFEYRRPEIISLSDHPQFTESWLQERIAEDPAILGLGDLVLRDRERSQPKAGRLDLLMEDAETRRRYEIELQLGQVDESHIIRTIEYWDSERKRYPQYDHCAVIIAEEITGRFLNVIGLFNGHIPLIAIQVKAVKVDNTISLIFTKVLDEIELGLEDDPASERLETNRFYWENRASVDTLRLVDHLHNLIGSFAPGFELKYNKFYIGLSQNGRARNFVAFKPQKKAVRIEFGMKLSQDFVARLEQADIEVFDYNPHWKQQAVRLTDKQIKEHEALVVGAIKRAYDDYNS